MPIDMRLGKLRGNTSADAMPIGPFRTYSQPVNLRDLETRFDAGDEVTPETLKAKRLIRKVSVDVKVLGVGDLSKALSVSAHGFSKTRPARRSRPPAARSPGFAASRSRRSRRGAEGEAGAPPEPDDEPEPSERAEPRGGRGRRGGLASARQRGGQTVFSWLANAWRVPELRRRLLFTAFVLAVYRLGSWIPAPGRRRGGDRPVPVAHRRDLQPAEPLLGRRAVAVLAVRARDHAVRHGLDHPPADDGRRSRGCRSCRRKASPATRRSTSTRAT